MAAGAMALILLGGGTEASGVDQGQRAQAPYALITGTVFRETGLAFPGAEVTLAAAGDSKGARKFKKIQVATSARGEFVLRVPAATMSFTVTAKASGYRAQEKPVTVTGEDRMDVFFRLEPASK
jgi:Carboxypeptidase regulatory-like domain